MAQIFISYRRADSQAITDRIYERLVDAFSEDAVFKDVDDIPLGEDFPTHLDKAIQNSKIVLVIMGHTWATISDKEGYLRLDDPNDFVRIEVETALNLPDAKVIPVLVNGATMPIDRQLPESLQPLTRLNAISIRNDPDFSTDIQRLIRNLQRLGIQSKRFSARRIMGILVAILIVIAAIWGTSNLLNTTDATQTPETIVTENTDETPLSGSGQVVFSRDMANQHDIFTLNVATGQEIQLTRNLANDMYPAWSPDSKQIAFQTDRDGNRDIYVMNADGSNPTNLTNNAMYDFDPTWSPDGKQIAFYSFRDGNWEIYAMDADGSNPHRLTTNPWADYSPAWSPDGEQIAFASDRDGNAEIYLLVGLSAVNLTRLASKDISPAWSPDGTQIAFVSERDRNQEIYIMNASGKNQHRITNNLAADSSPAWSPDGTQIAFISDRDGNQEIYVMNVDGSNVQRITDTPEDEYDPQWRP